MFVYVWVLFFLHFSKNPHKNRVTEVSRSPETKLHLTFHQREQDKIMTKFLFLGELLL